MRDLTQITCPPGLLTGEEFEALRKWPHFWEEWDGLKWKLRPQEPKRFSPFVIRARPAPVWQERDAELHLQGSVYGVWATIRHTGDHLPAGLYTGPDGATITVEGEL